MPHDFLPSAPQAAGIDTEAAETAPAGIGLKATQVRGAGPGAGGSATTLRGLLWPLGLLTAGLVAFICALLLFAANEQNLLALEASQHLAQSALLNEVNELKSAARDYATWDETVEKVVQELDETWADENIGTWAYEGLEMDGTLVLDGAGQVVYGMIDGERLGAEILSRITEGLVPLAAAARTADHGELGVALGGDVRLDGKIAVAAAAPIIREDGSAAHDRGGASSVLVFFRVFDSDLLTNLEESFLLPGLQLSGAPAADGASLPLSTFSGIPLGHLAWTAEQPGFLMLRPLLLPGAAAGTIGLLLLVIVIRRTSRTLQELEASHSALQHQAVELGEARDRALHQTRTETELRRNAVAASRAKSEFLALVSHELRTPLNAILGFSESIATQAFGRDATERYREYAEDIHESGSHLLSIINDILDLTKVEAGRYELHDEEVELDPLLCRCLALLRERASAKALVISYQDSGIRLWADARALKQIVINLLSNAIKFTGSGGRIELQVEVDAQNVTITVSDNGIGMGRDDLARALQPFGQADSSLSRATEGTGLGLNVTKALTELHGGRLEIRSAPAKGTEVTVRLPRARLLSGPAQAVSAQSA